MLSTVVIHVGYPDFPSASIKCLFWDKNYGSWDVYWFYNFSKLIRILGGGVQLGPLGTAATNRPIVPDPGDYDPIMMEKLVDWLAGETEVVGESLTQCRFVHHNPTCYPDANPGRRGGKPATNHLTYGTASSKLSSRLM
jgi:hypothetical protein